MCADNSVKSMPVIGAFKRLSFGRRQSYDNTLNVDNRISDDSITIMKEQLVFR